jgi:hypothetical protein
MKTKSVLFVAAAAIAACFGLALVYSHGQGFAWTARASESAAESDPLAHVNSRFSFTVHAPMAVAAPLFGPEGERSWGGVDWDPDFLYPRPARDVEGAVFLVQHGQHKSMWVATMLDFPAGHVQYVNIMDGAMVARIDIRLAPSGPGETAVTVVYERTALRPELNEHIRDLAKGDSESGPHWESNINDYLKAHSQQTR